MVGTRQVPEIYAQKARNLILGFLAFLYFLLDPINFVDSLARDSDKSLLSALHENLIIF